MGGLDRYDRETDSFVHYRHDPEEPTSLGNDIVYVLFEDSAGVLWVGSGAGLYRFDRAAGTFELCAEGGPFPYRRLRVQDLLEDRQQDLWIATGNAGALRWDRRGGTIEQYAFPSSLSRDVRAVLEDRDGDVWLATLDGLKRFHRATASFISYRSDADDPGSLATDHVESLLEDRRGQLWIGTDGAGLAAFDRASESFLRFEPDPEDDTTPAQGRRGSRRPDRPRRRGYTTGKEPDGQ